MNKIVMLFILIIGGQLAAQADINFSLESKYGNGKEITVQGSDNPKATDYNYLENILDINFYIGDNIYLYSQFEYSTPPIFGDSLKGLNTFYLEYNGDRYNIKLGDIYELIGRGLTFYTFQDQNIDYNNSIRGGLINYELLDNLSFSGLLGQGTYAYRSNPAFIKTDREYENKLGLISFTYEKDNGGNFHYSFLKQHSLLDPEFIRNIYYEPSEIGEEFSLSDRILTTGEISEDGNSAAYDYIFLYKGEGVADTIKIENHNFSWNTYLGPIELYIDKVWSRYSRIYGDDTFGSRFYASIYTDFLGTGITYEYKNYYAPYLLKSISNPPIGYRISNSVLAARNTHAMNFGNEIGHQIEINRSFDNGFSLLGNFSFARKKDKNNSTEFEYFTFFSLAKNFDNMVHYPFRQTYIEINGWILSDRLYIKLGLDQFSEILGYDNPQTSNILTFPTQFVWKFNNGNSITQYIELQKFVWEQSDKYLNTTWVHLINSQYYSVSFNKQGNWSLTAFIDKESIIEREYYDFDYLVFLNEPNEEKISNSWPGIDFTYYFNYQTQLSLFYGSQKGGLICANGICAEQPGFEDGIKITLRSIF